MVSPGVTRARVRALTMLLVAVTALSQHVGVAAAAPACHAASGAATRPLVELYTSEGCSDCPPADRWLSSTFRDAAPRPDGARAATISGAVAIALHVDYWDRLGWTDRFASHANTLRQYAAMHADGASFVYTPQVLLQGHDFPGWSGTGIQAALATAAARPAQAALSLEASLAGSRVTVVADSQVVDTALRNDLALHVAYVDSGLHSDVRAGENRGHRLTHDHVVRSLASSDAHDDNGGIHARLVFDRPSEAGTAPTIVAFLQRISNRDVLQALALPLAACGSP
ncbi:MAG TPA: DUF1223 domain-containing protein [Casimicrobiaceae bacterium]|nr:DUF1223 domain-containing protein [Casimicrobiaceae bacterium]